jgi:hypothetical protein
MKRGGPLKRKTPLRRVSKRRSKEMKEYGILRKEFLEKLPICEVCMKAKSTDIHHKAGRGKHYIEVETWLSTCRSCHDRIHREPSWAREKGFLI